MTKKVKQIGDIVLHKPLFVKEFNEPNDMQGQMVMSTVGTHIVYTAPIITPYITLETKEGSGWLDEDNVTDLKALWISGLQYDIIYTDDTTDTVRFANEKQIVFTSISIGACYYNVIIPLAKVS